MDRYRKHMQCFKRLQYFQNVFNYVVLHCITKTLFCMLKAITIYIQPSICSFNIPLFVKRQEAANMAQWKITLFTFVCCLNPTAWCREDFLSHALSTSFHMPSDSVMAVKCIQSGCTAQQNSLFCYLLAWQASNTLLN
jgi:hypothetical protein